MFLLADVIAIVICQIWLDVITIFCLPRFGRCYCHLIVVNLETTCLVVLWADVIARSCNKFGVQVKGGQTIKNLLMAPKDKDPITNKSGVIYRFKCSQHGCKEEYIGESARNFAERFKEHQKAPSPIFDHCNIAGHNINIINFTIVTHWEFRFFSGFR